MVDKSLTLNEFYSIYNHYLSKKPKNIYKLKKVNHIMFYKCVHRDIKQNTKRS